MTEKFLMARNVFQIFTENNPARGTEKRKKKKPSDPFKICFKIFLRDPVHVHIVIRIYELSMGDKTRILERFEIMIENNF